MKKEIIFNLTLNNIEIKISNILESQNIYEKNSEIVNKEIDNLETIILNDINDYLIEFKRNDKAIPINYFGNVFPLEINVSVTLDLNFILLNNIQDFFMEKGYKIFLT